MIPTNKVLGKNLKKSEIPMIEMKGKDQKRSAIQKMFRSFISSLMMGQEDSCSERCLKAIRTKMEKLQLAIPSKCSSSEDLMLEKHISLMQNTIMKSMMDRLILGLVTMVSISAVEEKRFQITQATGSQKIKMMAG